MSDTTASQATQGYPTYQLDVPIQAMLHTIHANQSPYLAWLATGLSDQYLGILGPAIEEQGPDGRLQTLDLSSNPDITDASVPRIIGLIQNSALQSLDLSSTGITTTGIARISIAMHQATRVMSVIFSEDLTISTPTMPAPTSRRKP